MTGKSPSLWNPDGLRHRANLLWDYQKQNCCLVEWKGKPQPVLASSSLWARTCFLEEVIISEGQIRVDGLPWLYLHELWGIGSKSFHLWAAKILEGSSRLSSALFCLYQQLQICCYCSCGQNSVALSFWRLRGEASPGRKCSKGGTDSLTDIGSSLSLECFFWFQCSLIMH